QDVTAQVGDPVPKAPALQRAPVDPSSALTLNTASRRERPKTADVPSVQRVSATPLPALMPSMVPLAGARPLRPTGVQRASQLAPGDSEAPISRAFPARLDAMGIDRSDAAGVTATATAARA